MEEFQLALVEEGAKRSGLLWLALPGRTGSRAAWHIWTGGAVYLVTGGDGEQPLPGLPEAATVAVTLRSKDTGGRLVAFEAAVAPVQPGTEEWDTVVPLLAKERLNARGGQAERWATESYVIRLTPVRLIDTPVDGYAAVRPVPTPAASTPPAPLMFGGKRRKADR